MDETKIGAKHPITPPPHRRLVGLSIVTTVRTTSLYYSRLEVSTTELLGPSPAVLPPTTAVLTATSGKDRAIHAHILPGVRVERNQCIPHIGMYVQSA